MQLLFLKVGLAIIAGATLAGGPGARLPPIGIPGNREGSWFRDRKRLDIKKKLHFCHPPADRAEQMCPRDDAR